MLENAALANGAESGETVENREDPVGTKSIDVGEQTGKQPVGEGGYVV